jgi:hypothetical protein
MNFTSPLWFFLALLATHWVGDFVLQTNWQAKHKSRSNIALSQHVLFYTLCLGASSALLFFPGVRWLIFTVGNGLLHFATDYCTSRWSARLFAKQEMRKFFLVVSFDQLIHQMTLGVTMLVIFFR